MQAAGIQVNLHYIPVYLQPFYASMGFQRGHCPNAEAYFKQAISIPMAAALSDTNQEYVIQQMTKALTTGVALLTY
jgi:dTDP-4-amino-4,6-dideoxygalactose transaminase